MAENKTKPTKASVKSYLDAIEDPGRREDCDFLVGLMTRITQHKPKMWAPGIVGFGNYHYKYASGREADAGLTCFASRKPDLSVYRAASGPDQAALLARLGKHKMGKACLSIRRLSEVDTGILEELVADSVAAIRRRYGSTDGG